MVLHVFLSGAPDRNGRVMDVGAKEGYTVPRTLLVAYLLRRVPHVVKWQAGRNARVDQNLELHGVPGDDSTR